MSVGYVLNAHLKQCTDMVVVQGVIYSLSLASVFNDPKGSQDPELMGYGRFALAAKYGNITHAMFPVQKRCDYLYPGRVPKCLEYLGKPQNGVG